MKEERAEEVTSVCCPPSSHWSTCQLSRCTHLFVPSAVKMLNSVDRDQSKLPWKATTPVCSIVNGEWIILERRGRQCPSSSEEKVWMDCNNKLPESSNETNKGNYHWTDIREMVQCWWKKTKAVSEYWLSTDKAKVAAQNKVSGKSEDESEGTKQLECFKKVIRSCEEMKWNQGEECHTTCELSNHCSPKINLWATKGQYNKQMRCHNVKKIWGIILLYCFPTMRPHVSHSRPAGRILCGPQDIKKCMIVLK